MKETLPEYYTLLLSGPPGIGKFDYCLDLVSYWLDKGERVVYLTTERSPSEIKTRSNSIGLDLDNSEGSSLVFVDCFSWSIGESYDKGFNIDNPANLNQININMEKAVDNLGKPVRIIFDSLSPLFLHNPPEMMTKSFQILTSRAKTDYGCIIYTLQEGVHDPQIVNTLIYLVDGYLQMKFEEEETLERMLRVHHLKGIPHDSKWISFEIDSGFKVRSKTKI